MTSQEAKKEIEQLVSCYISSTTAKVRLNVEGKLFESFYLSIENWLTLGNKINVFVWKYTCLFFTCYCKIHLKFLGSTKKFDN